MMQNGRREAPYRGLWALCLLLVAVPLGCYGIMYLAIGAYQTHLPSAMNRAGAQLLGFGIGSVFHLSCMVAGMFRKATAAVRKRVGEFFANLTVSVGFACRCYWDDIKEDGAEMVIYLLIIGACLWLALDGGIDFVQLWTAYRGR